MHASLPACLSYVLRIMCVRSARLEGGPGDLVGVQFIRVMCGGVIFFGVAVRCACCRHSKIDCKIHKHTHTHSGEHTIHQPYRIKRYSQTRPRSNAPACTLPVFENLL